MTATGKVLCVAGLCVLAGCAEQTAPTRSGRRPRVGVYDSRAIAIAYVGSPAYQATDGRKLAQMKEEYDRARAEGDGERIWKCFTVKYIVITHY